MAVLGSLLLFTAFVYAAAQDRAEDTSRRSVGQEWSTVGGDMANSRYSTLSQINAGNVKSLGGAWVHEFALPTRATPVVKDGMMFIPDAARVYCLNANDGQLVWSYQPEKSAPARSGVAVGDGRVYSGLDDGRVIALDEHKGTLLWTQTINDPPPAKQGRIGGALVYADGLVLVGLTGEPGSIGRLVAFDGKTGKQAWVFYSVPAPGDPGSETWPADMNPRSVGGGGIWNNPAVDLDLGLVYFGIGNAVPQWGGELRPGNNLFNVSVVALELKTGKLRWYYQLVHHDIWDMDEATPMLLYDALVDGNRRKALAAMRTDGYLFLLDRETGKPIFPVEERSVPQEPRQKTSPTQPFPVNADRLGKNCLEAEMVPKGFAHGCWFEPWYYDRPNVASIGITTRAAPMAYSPDTKYFYVMGGLNPWWFRRVDNPYYYFWSHIPTAKQYGLLAAVDSRTDKIVWQKQTRWDLSMGSGFLSTAGNLVFYMDSDGTFQALDPGNGDVLWRFQTGYSGARGGAPVTYEMDGQQYLAVPSDRGLWGFRLGGAIGARPAAPAPAIETAFTGLIEDLPNDGTGEIAVAAVRFFQGEHFQDEYALKPARVRVKVSTKVNWLNYGLATHTIAAQDGSWSTGPLAPGKTGSVTFDKPGTYFYICKDHPWTMGQIIVQ